MYTFNKETLDYEKATIFFTPLKTLVMFISLIIIMGFTFNPSKVDISKEEKLIVIREYNSFSEKALIKKISGINFKFPYIILAQSYQETGHYTSVIFKENNNLFGMKEAELRASIAKGTKRNHAYYDEWQDSVVDYALYYSTYLYDIKTEGEYFEYLKQNYAEDPMYVQRIKAIIKKYHLKEKFKK